MSVFILCLFIVYWLQIDSNKMLLYTLQYLSSYLNKISVVKAAFCFRVMYLLMDFSHCLWELCWDYKKILNMVFFIICCTFIDPLWKNYMRCSCRTICIVASQSINFWTLILKLIRVISCGRWRSEHIWAHTEEKPRGHNISHQHSFLYIKYQNCIGIYNNLYL